MNKVIMFIVSALPLISCVSQTWTKAEKDIIDSESPVLRILSIQDPADSVVLRKQSTDISVADINSEFYNKLVVELVETLKSTEGGVGLAAPQIGVNRRVVCVQRVDKEGEPLEVYPNIRITAMRGDKECGGEGCLSVPDMYGQVMRSRDIDIAYTSVETMNDTTERIRGFAAVIFQHEVDHLEGVIYTDKLAPRI